jgi:hypothetical protein
LGHFIFKVIILPRQARDKSKGKLKKEMCFAQDGDAEGIMFSISVRSTNVFRNRRVLGFFGLSSHNDIVLINKTDRFAKTDPGQA